MKRLYFLIFLLISGTLFLQGITEPDTTENDKKDKDSGNSNLRTNEIQDSFGIAKPALNLALNGLEELKRKQLLKADSIITIIDFSRSSTEKRLFIVDLKNEKLLKNTFVAHGVNSGVQIAKKFSNKRYSNMSSLGIYVTKGTYMGKHGYSLRIEGLNEGLNDNALKRAIVIHGASYVSKEYINKYGRLGRSFGCPAISYDESKEIIDLIKNGTCLFIYHPSLQKYFQKDLGIVP